MLFDGGDYEKVIDLGVSAKSRCLGAARTRIDRYGVMVN